MVCDNCNKEIEGDKKNEKDKKYQERFVRWQQLTITQLSNTNNLIITLTLGLLAFSVSKLGVITPINCNLCVFTFLGYFLLIISLIAGIALTFNRLYDFRKTTKLIKLRRDKLNLITDKEQTEITTKITNFGSEIKQIGEITWCFLYFQLGTFLLGSILLMLTILIQINSIK